MVALNFRAFFNARPFHALPALDASFMAFLRSARRSLATPPHLRQHPAHMVAVVSDAEAAVDDVGHPPRRPQFGGVPPSSRSPHQFLLQLEELLGRQLGRAPGSSRFLQPGQTFPFETLLPATDRLAMHAHPASDFGWLQATLEQAGRSQPPPFQGGKIALCCGLNFHGHRVT